jgi:hypothetical protein
MLQAQQHQLPRPLSEIWPRLKPPLRPSSGDLGAFQQAIDGWTAGRRARAAPPQVLLLGATPELRDLDWPPGSQISVLERDSAVASEIWKRPLDDLRAKHWLALTPQDGTFDIVMCDAGLHTMTYPKAQGNLAEILAAVTLSGAIVVFRLCPPSQHESTVRVAAELWAGNISDMSQLMLRTAQSMQHPSTAGVRVSTLWLKLRSLSKNWKNLAERTGWELEDIQVADLYRFSAAKCHYPDLVQTMKLIGHNSTGGFDMIRLSTGDGPLAAQCPVVTFERRE